MIYRPDLNKKRKEADLANRIVGAAGEEVEKIGDSILSQVTGEAPGDQTDPIAEAMQQKTEYKGDKDEKDIDKEYGVKKMRSFIERREDLENELREVRKKSEEQEREWNEEVKRRLTIVDPGASMEEKTVLPLTTKPKRGQMPGKPGTARGETGPEVRKSKQ